MLWKITIFTGITLALQNNAKESMTFIVPILEMSLQKDSISSLSHIMLADLEENSDWWVSVLFDDEEDMMVNINLLQNQYLPSHYVKSRSPWKRVSTNICKMMWKLIFPYTKYYLFEISLFFQSILLYSVHMPEKCLWSIEYPKHLRIILNYHTVQQWTVEWTQFILYLFPFVGNRTRKAL